ncbi:NADH-quinone oxidoreductase subunit 5 family protein [Ornithinicoccus halotolerans]|uniref:NADH-quinone oxidoreductase subunit 5 family protein n=1 Tax=Ornithinicoccus halotolerans TaxID=1748220 RepID=UPI001296A10E|nr:NADH-quinone oxidoreductase subunit L [Ornithinicoccus halotolerans]
MSRGAGLPAVLQGLEGIQLPGLPSVPDHLDWPVLDPSALPLPDLSFLPGPAEVVPDLPGTAAQWAVLLPLLAAALTVGLVRRSSRAAAWATIPLTLLTLLATLWHPVTLAAREGEPPRHSSTVGPLALGELVAPLELQSGRLVVLLAVVVATVALAVQVFARWYLFYDPRYRPFAATVSLFTAAMMLVVHSDDVLLTLVGWEVMGWCSYLLIGHYSAKDSANRAATKALLVTRVADVGFVIGLVVLAAGAGSTRLSDIVEHWSGPAGGDGPWLALAMTGVVLGVAGKSAQVPFQDWLPDAMAGPTPASALIHAATMVAAGAVVLAQLLPLLQSAGPARLLLAVLTAVTVVGAALMAFAQPDLKRVLAWSTVSQVGLMLAVLAVVPAGQGPDAALMQLTSHAWFKALLFLALGWLGVLTGGTAVVHVVGGTTRFRTLRRPLAVGLLALAGVPPLVGFFSKELLLAQVEAGVEAGPGVAATVVLAAVGASVPLTAAYCMRAWLVLGRGQHPVLQQGATRIDDFFIDRDVLEEAAGVEEAESAISSSARSAVTALSVLTVLGGLLALTPVLQVELVVNVPLLAVSLLLMALAALVVWALGRGVRTRDAAARLPHPVVLAAERGLGFGRVYTTAVAVPVLAAARAVRWLDREVLDGYVRGLGHLARGLGAAGAWGHRGAPGPAMLAVLAGAVLVAAVGVVTG